MYSINAPYTIEKMESPESAGRYLLTVNSKPYSIGELLFVIINAIASGRSIKDTAEELNHWSKNRYAFTEDKIESIIEKNIRPLGLLDATREEATTGYMASIKGKWTLAKYHHMRVILSIMKYLFYPAVFFPILAITTGFNVYYMAELTRHSASVEAMFAAQGTCLWSLSNIQYYYPLALIIIFLHELGHAASAHLFGIKTKRIGFGFYLIFPVMFADVTGVWKLSRIKRSIINLGGIYIQLIINLALIYWIYHSPDLNTTIVIKYLITVNVAMVILNINPFFKFDGYWVYSDLCNLPNLKQQSNAYVTGLLKRIFPRAPIQTDPGISQIMNPKNPFLIAYTFLKYIFIGYVFYIAGTIVSGLVADVKTAAAQLYQLDFSICAVESYFSTLCATGALTYITYRSVRQFSERSAAISQKMRAHYQARPSS